jgi:hypothetical protein
LDIPLKFRLPNLLKQITDFRIVRFQDNGLTNSGLHWYVAIPVEDSFLLICIITSKGKERAAYYKRTKQPRAADCLVPLSNDEFAFLHKDSVVNCNEADYVSIDELVQRVDLTAGFVIEKEKVAAYLKEKVVSAIIKSPLVPKAIGKLAKKANPL